MKPNRMQSFAFAVALTGCAASGTRPHDMSIHGHEAAAKDADQKAIEDEQQSSDAPSMGSTVCTLTDCWSISTSEDLLERSQWLRRVAEKHRAASQALRDAEAQQCAGIRPEDRDISPFFHTGGILQIITVSRGEYRVVFRSAPGLSVELFQSLLDCHIARNAALGHKDDAMPFCPLVPKGVEARVSPEGETMVVVITVRGAKSRAAVAQRIEELRRTWSAP